jgi:hypothetical protein
VASIKLNQFNGIMPRVAPKLLPANAAQTAQNVNLLSGRLEAILSLGSTEDTQAGNTIYKWRRNDTFEWLSMSGIEDFVVGPIADDDYDRVYYTDSGTLKMHAWSGSKQTRTVGLTAPDASHVPSITSSAVNKWLFDPGSGSNNVRCDAKTTNTVPFGTNNDTETGVLDKWEYTEDGKLHLYFTFPAQRYPVISGASWASYTAKSVVTFQLTMDPDGGGDEDLPATMGNPIEAESLDLLTGGTKYGEFQVERVNVRNRLVTWIDGSTGVDLVGGLPTGSTAVCTVSDYSVEFICNLNYVTAHGSNTTHYAHYVQTYVDDFGEESPPSAVSEEVVFVPGQQVALSLGADPGGNIDNRRLYRSAAGSVEDAFFFVAEIAAATTTYTDTLADSELGEVLPEFENPPGTLTGICGMPNGFLAGWAGKNLYFSEPWHPYSWPTAYQLTVDHDIIGLAATRTDLVVLTKGEPYIVTGSAPSNLTVEKIPFAQACASRRSIAVMGDAVLYASPDGVAMIRNGAGRLLTEKYYQRSDWQALTPSSGIAGVQDRKYYLWTTGAKLVFDIDEGLAAITTHDISATAVHTDLEDDTLYVSQSGAIKAWEGTATKKTITWKSKDFSSTRLWAPVCGRIVADSYNVTLKLYAAGSLVSTITVEDESAFRIPILRHEKRWALEVQNDDTIDEIHLATSMKALR